MFETTVSPGALGDRAAAIAVKALWQQWSVLNPAATSNARDTRCVVDLEALVLTSGALIRHERRFVDLLYWLARQGSGYLSVQRMRTLATAIPQTDKSLGTFAFWAAKEGMDKRWRSLASEASEEAPRSGKGPELPQVRSPAALMLRLRAGFGVGVKADLLTHLICLHDEPRSAIEIAEAIGYSDKTVRLAVRELRLAGLVDEVTDYPVKYAMRTTFAQGFLGLIYGAKASIPDWCHWSQVYGFLLTVAAWRKDPRISDNDYIASSLARDLYSRYEVVFRTQQLRFPRPEPHLGAEYYPVFAEFVSQIGSWLESGNNA